MSFCTVVNCMDGRVQLPVIEFLQQRFEAEHVDSITEPGPIRILARQDDQSAVQSVVTRLKISIEKHGSSRVAVAGHHDCAGNPVGKEEQLEQIRQSLQFLQERFQGLEMIGLWVDAQWKVHEVA